MSDFENKDLQPQGQPQDTPGASIEQPAPEGQAPVESQPAPPVVEKGEKPTPHLTLEPDIPEPPAYGQPGPHIPGSAAEPFDMPEPPRAPEPNPQPRYQYQQTPPQYGAPQYTAQQEQPPQYQPPQYSQMPQQPYYTPQYNTPPAGYVQKSRLAAGLLAIMLGCLGIHNYYLGFNTRGTIQLVVSLAGGLLTCGVATAAVLIWGFIEGIMILSAQPSRMYDGNGVILRD